MKTRHIIIAASVIVAAAALLVGATHRKAGGHRIAKHLGHGGVTTVSAIKVPDGITINAQAEIQDSVCPQRAWWYVEFRDQRLQHDSVIWSRDYAHQPMDLAIGVLYRPTFNDTIHPGPVPSGRYNILVGIKSEVPVTGPDGVTSSGGLVAANSTWIDW